MFKVNFTEAANTSIIQLAKNSVDENPRSDVRKISVIPANCIQSPEQCMFTCIGASITTLHEPLEQLFKYCKTNVALNLMNCFFPGRIFSRNFLQGNFRLSYLRIEKCNIETIEKGAFNHTSVRNLSFLHLSLNDFTTMAENTFEGLQNLQNFEFFNVLSYAPFDGNGFMKPVSHSLTTAIIKITSERWPKQDPSSWFQSAKMINLFHINLSGNDLRALYNNTFSALVCVRNLILSDCLLRIIEENVFDSILGTLRLLDLSNNQLTIFQSGMLMKMSNIELYLIDNVMYCTCANKELLQILKWNERNIMVPINETLECYGRPGVKLVDVNLDCQEEEATSRATTSMSILTSTTILPTGSIKCYSNDREKTFIHKVERKICTFSIRPFTSTSLEIFTYAQRSFEAIFYFVNTTNYNLFTDLKFEKEKYFGIIENLNATETYVFCCLEQVAEIENHFHSWPITVSPFACRSFSQFQIMPKQWLAKKDQVWVASVVALGSCLFLFFGFLCLFMVLRKKLRNRNRVPKTLNSSFELEDLKEHYTNYIITDVHTRASLNSAQHPPAENAANSVEINSDNNLYEELSI